MNFQQSANANLLLPVEPPKEPQRNLGPLELTSPDGREIAKQALSMLWVVCDLKGSSLIQTPDAFRREAHRAAYDHIATMLLGDDQPEREVLT